jgi:hypothetical protein
LQGFSFWEFWKERGFKWKEIETFVVELDKDIHGAITDSHWWEEKLFGAILKEEGRNGGFPLEKDAYFEIAREVLEEIGYWDRPGRQP